MEKKRICIVDDQPIVIEALNLIFEDEENIEVVGSFTSSQAFINEYETLLPDVTIMDLDLPVMSGIEAIVTIKSNYPRAKFIVLTNYADDERLFNALKAGAAGYLLKKKSFENIVQSIESVCNGGAPMTPEIARKVVDYFRRHSNSGIGKFQHLTERETLVLQLLAEGFLYKEIAAKSFVSVDTVKKIVQRVYEKLQVHTRSEAIKKYLTS